MESLAVPVGIGALLLMLIVGVHIGFALMISGFLGTLLITGDAGTVIRLAVTTFYHQVTQPGLITLPLFVMMGYLASGGGISRNVYQSLSLWLGSSKSGLGIATVLGCTAFGTVCGSSLVTTAVFTKVGAPEMRRHGYDKRLAYGICASSGAIGMLIPPSILAIVYAMLSGESVAKILMAGVAPGIMFTIVFILIIISISKIRPSMVSLSGGSPATISATWKEKVISLKHWWTIVVVATIIFGGIYGGVFSPSEASAAAAFVLLAVYLTIVLAQKQRFGSILKELNSMFKETVITTSMIFFVMGSATLFARFITLAGLTGKVSIFLMDAGISPFSVVLVIVFLMLIMGMFLDSISILSITIPVLNPIIRAFGIDPIWYATIIIVSIELGLITPPFGLNVFAAKGAAEPDVRLEDIFSGAFPFLIGMAFVLVALLLFPSVSTFLPGLIE